MKTVVTGGISLADYQILEPLYAGSRTLVYRAARVSDRKSVILKLLRKETPTFGELMQFRNQYAIVKNLNLPGVIQFHSLEACGNGYVLVMEDFGGISLKSFAQGQPLDLTAFLLIALQLADVLHQLYQHSIIHKDIKPANILIHPETKQVKLIDFSISSLLPRETQEVQNPNVLEGTLAYLSPEQTGRMNRGIDYRSDFYSLGVTFYELLTGVLPFQASDPMELVHAHLARTATPVEQVNPLVPGVISAIVAKLMAKNAEDRYQSALGLKHDLQVCWEQVQATGQIQPFALAQQDRCNRFLIPEKLYGRQAEVTALLDAFERVSLGSAEIMLVAGFSGIGKTAVVNEVHKPIVKKRGYFIQGKFDQFQRDIPLSAFVQALRDLMAQLLSESDTQLEGWRQKILQVLGKNGQVLVEVIPELEQIIGTQPPVPDLTGSAAQNRFNRLLRSFIQVFAAPEHPLVIFIDDLQWADPTSLKLMQQLMGAAETRHLLFIGAYRDNEVTPGHALLLTLEEIAAVATPIDTITLAPLAIAFVNQLIADTLSCSLDLAAPLTELVMGKTQGNPFFLTQFLKALHEDGHITFNRAGNYWECDVAQVRSLALTDDVVEFMALQLQKLPADTQTVLQLAACIGNQFDLATLAIVHGKSEAETAADLWRSLQEGLVLPQNEVYKFFQADIGKTTDKALEPDRAIAPPPYPTESIAVTYKFLHDRVQQAAYSLIHPEQQILTHYCIGQRLLQHTSQSGREDRIFELVNQLNVALELIRTSTEQEELARLNLLAARKAKHATAYSAAANYCTTGRKLLAPNSWQSQYELTLALFEEATEVAYLSGDFDTMTQLAQVVLRQARTVLDQVKVYEIKIQACAAQNAMQQAVETTLEILALLGFRLPAQPTPADLQQHEAELQQQLQRRKTSSREPLSPLALADLPELTDQRVLAAVTLMSSAMTSAYNAAPVVARLLAVQQVKLLVEYGNAPVSASSYAWYGLVLAGIVGDIETGYQFGQLALQLLEKFDARAFEAKTIFAFNVFIRHRKEHLNQTLKPLLESYQSGMAIGDFEYASRSSFQYGCHSFMASRNLPELEVEMANYSQIMDGVKQTAILHKNEVFRWAVLQLMGQSQRPMGWDQPDFSDAELLDYYLSANDRTTVFMFAISRLMVYYLLGELKQATDYAKICGDYFDSGAAFVLGSVYNFYDSLVCLAQLTQQGWSSGEAANHPELAVTLEKVAKNQASMAKWASHAPMNYAHKFQLVEAERYRVLGDKVAAIAAYDQAIALANEHGYLNEAALANELAARFLLEWGKPRVAQDYLLNAYYGYVRWGATAKVQALENCYPALVNSTLASEAAISESSHFGQSQTINPFGGSFSRPSTSKKSATSSAGCSGDFDLATVIKASQALSSEIQLDKLIAKLLQVVSENAGADRCVLLLVKEAELVIAAISHVDQPAALLQSLPLADYPDLPVSLIHTVKHSLQPAVIINAVDHPTLMADPYILSRQPKSLLCTPLLYQAKLLGILYLENNLITGAFTSDRVEILNFLCTQAAISLENARLYQQAQSALEHLQQTQLQLVQNEKMSALGNLVAGVAHEINNPVGFIAGNLNPARDYVNDLMGLIDRYQQAYPEPGEALQAEIEAIDLDYIRTDLPKLLESMKLGVQRIRDISTSLRTFSRADKDYKVPFNLHEGIDSTLLILKHRLKASAHRPEIQVCKHYSDLPLVDCFAGQLNQVFMNLLANAIDALEEALPQKVRADAGTTYAPTITICTELSAPNQVRISIADNGTGMTDAVKARVFDHLFTTKAVGKGTGLGLAIARQIVEEKHAGSIHLQSVLGQGTEFVLLLPVKTEAPN